MSPSMNTFFGVKLDTIQVLTLMFSWIIELPIKIVAQHTGVSKKTAIDFFSFFREIAEIIVPNMTLQIGGSGLHMEVDETFLRRRKYNRRRFTSGHTVVIFGAYCRETKEGMFWKVDIKSRRILWSHMIEFIAPGSIIVSDSAPQYSGCTSLGFLEHYKVNYREVRKSTKFRSTYSKY